MSSSDFRQITVNSAAPKGERLFRAAVTAFCSLTRPSRREIAQLDDLTLPLFDVVSVESRRYVAAALSKCQYAPEGLVKRLCDQPVDIAAPLLIQSKALSDIDLIALIGRHGHGHARAIGRRHNLNPTIARLVEALNRRAAMQARGAQANSGLHQDYEKLDPELNDTGQRPGAAAENARRRLRSMMRPAGDATATINPFIGANVYGKLRDTALTGIRAFFQTALADTLELDFQTAGRIVGSSSYAWLLTALRALDLKEDQAFLITAAILPQHFAHPEAIRLFLSRFHLLHRDGALDRVRAWKAESLAAAMDTSGSRIKGANLEHLEAEPRTRMDLRIMSQ